MRNFSYYVFNLAVVAGPLFILATNKTIRMKRAGLIAVGLAVSVPFIMWDVWAAAAGHWGFNERFVSGPYILGIPLEEILFFITVPFAMLFVWEVVRLHWKERLLPKYISYGTLAITSALSIVLLVDHWGKGYTRSVALALLLVSLVLWKSGLFASRRFWIFSTFHLLLFFVANSVLTALPVITYGVGSYIGYRLGTIPLEDFIFSYCMIGASVWQYNRSRDEREKPVSKARIR